MALERMMNPPMLDTTGQSIVTKLEQIKSAVQPTNSCLDVDISIPANGWSSSAPYTYTYTNNHISSGCSVKVNFLEGAQSANVLYLEFEKIVNGVRFTSATKPTTAIPVRLHILNADATSAMATTADEVSTSAVSGSANVEDALGLLNGQIGTLNSNIANLQSKKSDRFINSYIGNGQNLTYLLTGDTAYLAILSFVASSNVGAMYVAVIACGSRRNNTGMVKWLTSEPASNAATVTLTDGITLNVTTAASVWADFALMRL